MEYRFIDYVSPTDKITIYYHNIKFIDDRILSLYKVIYNSIAKTINDLDLTIESILDKPYCIPMTVYDDCHITIDDIKEIANIIEHGYFNKKRYINMISLSKLTINVFNIKIYEDLQFAIEEMLNNRKNKNISWNSSIMITLFFIDDKLYQCIISHMHTNLFNNIIFDIFDNIDLAQECRQYINTHLIGHTLDEVKEFHRICPYIQNNIPLSAIDNLSLDNENKG